MFSDDIGLLGPCKNMCYIRGEFSSSELTRLEDLIQSQKSGQDLVFC